MLNKLLVAGSALALTIMSRNAAAGCWANGCSYAIGKEPAGSWLSIDVYAGGTLYVTAYTQVDGNWTYIECGVPTSNPNYANYVAVALSAMNTPVSTYRPTLYFDINSQDGWTCSTLELSNVR